MLRTRNAAIHPPELFTGTSALERQFLRFHEKGDDYDTPHCLVWHGIAWYGIGHMNGIHKTPALMVTRSRLVSRDSFLPRSLSTAKHVAFRRFGGSGWGRQDPRLARHLTGPPRILKNWFQTGIIIMTLSILEAWREPCYAQQSNFCFCSEFKPSVLYHYPSLAVISLPCSPTGSFFTFPTPIVPLPSSTTLTPNPFPL